MLVAKSVAGPLPAFLRRVLRWRDDDVNLSSRKLSPCCARKTRPSCLKRPAGSRVLLSQGHALPAHRRRAWPRVSGQPVCRAVPAPRPACGGAGPARAGRGAAVHGKPVRPRGGRRRAGPDRLEVCAGPGPHRPWLRPHGVERVPHPPGHRRCRAFAARQPVAALAGAGPGQGARAPAHGQHPRARRRAHAEPAGAALLHGPGVRAQLPQPRLWFRRCGWRSGVQAPACG